MINKTIIANIIQLICTLASLYAINIINRRKSYRLFLPIHSLHSIVYLILGSLRSFYSCLWAAIKVIIVLTLHKEEKIIYKPWEAILFASPYLILGTITLYKTGNWFLFLVSITEFMSGTKFYIKKDINKESLESFNCFIWAINDIMYFNIVGFAEYIISTIIHIKNTILIYKNGEEMYYAKNSNNDKTNVETN